MKIHFANGSVLSTGLDIGVDLNGTLDTMHHVVCTRYNLRYGANISPKDITAWDMEATYPGLSRIYYESGVVQQSQPAMHAVAVTKWLVEQGHAIYVVSATTRYSEAKRWLRKFFPHITSYIFAPAAAKRLLRLDVRIGDAAFDMDEASLSLLIDQPWNQDVQMGMRVKSWLEIPGHVAAYIEKTAAPFVSYHNIVL